MNIENKINTLEKQIKYVNTYLSKHPFKSISFNNERGRFYMYLKEHDLDIPLDKKELKADNQKQNQNITQASRHNKNGKYIPISSPQIATLANVKYYKMLLPVLKEELKVLQTFQSKYHPDKKFQILESIPERFKDKIDLIVKSPEMIQKEWAKKEHRTNPYPFNEEQKFVSKNGEPVRSKAEYIIANLLDEMNLTYRYEAEFSVANKKTYPDFTIMHPTTCELYYLEYFGMMDDDEYLAAALKKISAYQRTPEASHFIYIFESKYTPMNIQTIQSLLSTIFFTE